MRNKIKIMKKDEVWDDQINPDGISNKLSLNEEVWDRGYCCETEDGIWYEVYVNDETKGYWPVIDLLNEEHAESFGKFHDLLLDHYEADNQITLFVPDGEKVYTLDELHQIFV
jgi:hypothetical protein